MPCLLFVDDDPLALQLYRKLAEISGCQALTAGSGEEACAVLESSRPDLAFIDHNLPDGTGLELVARLRQNGASDGMPMLILSAGSGGDDLQAALQGGAQGFLSKPLGFAQLADAVREFVR